MTLNTLIFPHLYSISTEEHIDCTLVPEVIQYLRYMCQQIRAHKILSDHLFAEVYVCLSMLVSLVDVDCRQDKDGIQNILDVLLLSEL